MRTEMEALPNKVRSSLDFETLTMGAKVSKSYHNWATKH